MPLELSPFVVRRELMELRARDPSAADNLQRALEWVCGELDRDPLILTRYDLQTFLWYLLPRKWLTSLEHQRSVTVALARFLERVDDRARDYSALCRSEDTLELLDLWEHDDGRASDRFQALMEGSGLEPPDTELLAWRGLMGAEEADLRHEAALVLETALEDGAITPGARDFNRRRSATLARFLSESRADLDGRTPVEVVNTERLEHWLERGSPERRKLLDRVAASLRAPVADTPLPAIEAALEPLSWLLRAASDGIALTQTYALNRAFVREAVERYPDWWRPYFGPPNREADVTPLAELAALIRTRRLVRRRGRRLGLTRRGADLLANPRELLSTVTEAAFATSGFDAAVHELSAAVLTAEQKVATSSLDAKVHRTIVADGWHDGAASPSERDVRWVMWELIRPALALGLVRDEGEWSDRRLIVTEVGRAALRGALRRRATAPVDELS